MNTYFIKKHETYVTRPIFKIETHIDPDEVIEKIRAWNPLFEVTKESTLMLPDELVFDVIDLARMYDVKIQIAKMRRRTRYFFALWSPQGQRENDEDDEGEEEVEITEKTDYDTIKDMIYELVKQKKQCRIGDLKQHFDEKGIIVGQDKIRELLRQLHDEGKIRYSGIMIKLIEKDAT